MDKLLEILKVPGSIAGVIVVIYLVLQVIGELCAIKGKIVPEWMKIVSKIRKSRKAKKEAEQDRVQTLKDVKKLLSDVNAHYSEDNIAQRNDWMDKVNTNIAWTEARAKYYDESINKLTSSMGTVVTELTKLRKQSEEDHAQRIRNKIIEFASKVVREDYRATHDEFNYIFRIYEEYEHYLDDHDLENGQVEGCMEIIKEEHKDYIRHNRFLEAKRSLPN